MKGRLTIACIASLSLLSCHPPHPLARSVQPITEKDKVWNASNVTVFEEELESLRRRYHIPGLSAGIVDEEKLVWKKGFGYSDLEKKMLPDENTFYQIASVTKTFGL